jgi:virginiamycin B lyase
VDGRLGREHGFQDNAVVSTITLDHGPLDLAANDTAVWVTMDNGQIARIDPSKNSVASTIDVGSEVDQIIIGDDTIWVTVAKGVVPIDIATSHVGDVVATGDSSSRLAFGAGSLWVSDAGVSAIARVDSKTKKVVANILFDSAIGGMVVSGTDVWASIPAENKVDRVDTASNKIVGSIKVGAAPAGLVDGFGTVWVGNPDDHSITRFAAA